MMHTLALAFLPLLAGSPSLPAQTQAIPSQPIESSAGLIHPRRLMIELEPGAGEDAIARAHARAGGRVLQDLPQIGWQIVEVDPRLLFQARETYLAEPAIRRADF